nr:MAG TPA: hypothetical protein [Caudoviricetes sp.]
MLASLAISPTIREKEPDILSNVVCNSSSTVNR